MNIVFISVTSNRATAPENFVIRMRSNDENSHT